MWDRKYDKFVGLPFKLLGREPRGIDCWGLVRLVLIEIAGVEFPRYDEDDPSGKTIGEHSSHLRIVNINEARELDCALMPSNNRRGGTHIGIFVDRKNILHIESGNCSRIDMIDMLTIRKVIRVK